MGDLFQGWIARADGQSALKNQTLNALREVKAQGVEVIFVVGNRDYLVERQHLAAVFSQVIDDESTVTLTNQKITLLHGDRVNRGDRMYLAWRRLSRSRAATTLLKRLPAKRIGPFETKLERLLGKTNQRYKQANLPLAALTEVHSRAKNAGVDRVLIGHFHQFRTLDFGEAPELIIVPGWGEYRRVLEITDQGPPKPLHIERLRKTIGDR